MVEAGSNAVRNESPIERVGPYSYEEFLDRVRSFHGYAAPGVIVGGLMVDMAMEQIPKDVQYLAKGSKGRIGVCRVCGEAYPVKDGPICKGCQGEAPYESSASLDSSSILESPPLKAVPIDQAVGKTALHDMTQVVPGESKGAAFKKGQQIDVGDLCRLRQMGRRRVYVLEDNVPNGDWVHEDEAAVSFARAMAGEGVTFQGPPREGRIRLTAARDGLFVVDSERLEGFNMVPGVMCASRRGFTVVSEGKEIASTRAIPLYLSARYFHSAVALLEEGPLFQVLPLRKARAGILVTGTEVFEGITEDKFVPIITAKLNSYGCQIVESRIVPDDREAICNGVKDLVGKGIDLLVTTGGLSVDPDDVTRHGLADAGATDLLYGSPLVPGAMILLGRIGDVQMMGVPAGALHFETTAFDVLLPRLLAGLSITRRDLAAMGHGGLCLQCETCRFPECAFGR